MQASSAISFRLPPASISAAASSGSPLPSTCVSGFSGPFSSGLATFPFGFLTPAVFAFFRPLQFWVLTTQPLFLPFRLFPRLPHSGFPGASFRFRFQIFRLPFRLVSHASLSVSRTRLPVCFLSPFPDSLPQLFLRCLLSHCPLPFRSLSFPSVPLPATQLDCSSFQLIPAFVSQRLSRFFSGSFVPSFFLFLPDRFPVPSVRFCLLSLLLVSFRPSRFHSRSWSPGACLRSHSGIFHSFRSLSVPLP